MMKKALYAGSLDPIHKGHVDIIRKAIKLFDVLYVVITENINKNHKYSISERKDMVVNELKGLSDQIIVLTNEDKLTGDLALELGVKYLVRGIRDSNDLNYEIQLADANKTIYNDLETVFFTSDIDNREISSSLIKEIQHYKTNKGE